MDRYQNNKNDRKSYYKNANNTKNSANKDSDVETLEFEIEDLLVDDATVDIKDAKVDIKASLELKEDKKIDNDIKSFNSDNTTLAKDINSDNISEMENGDIKKNQDEKLDFNDANSNQMDNLNDYNSHPNNELDADDNNFNKLHNDTNPDNLENKSLKDKINDTKDKINNTKDKIKNAPENIKNKVNDTKDKINNTKDKIKNAPENLRQKKEQAKEKWDNRPKNMREAKDRIKNSNIKDKIKNNAKNNAKKVANKAKESAKDSFDNSNLGQAINKGKDAIEKGKKAIETGKKAGKAVAKTAKLAGKAAQGLINLFISTLPWSAIVILIILLMFILVAVIMSFAPGVGGNPYDEDFISNYSKTDQKTLEKLKDLFDKYPDADGTLAMATVLYPYFDSLKSGNVTAILYSSNNEEEETIEEGELITEPDDDDEDIEDDGTDPTMDDPYLIPFRKFWVRHKLKRILKEIDNNKVDKDNFSNYLKNTYFMKDKGFGGYEETGLIGFNGYKAMFDSIVKEDRETLADEIINDLEEKKDWFVDYVYERVTCSSNSQSIGYHDNLGLINGEAVVILKDTTSGNFDIIKNADSLFGTDDLHLDLKRYAMGVAYNETGDNVKNEALAKAELITIKSFVLGRTAPGSRTTVGMGYKTDTIDGKTVFYMRGNTYDQGFCDIYEGCQDGSKYAKSLVKSDPNGEMTGNKKPALSKEDIANLEKWYDETAGEFIFDDKNKAFNGSQYRDYNTSNLCKPGSCLSQLDAISLAKSGMDYKTILFQKAYSENRFTLYNSDTETISAVSVNCNDASSVCGINEKDFIYYSQKVGEYSSEAFCNSDSTIKEGGCGITSMAMVIANLSDVKVNPSITNTEAYNGGFCGSERGTDAGYFSDAAKRYGLSLTSVVKTDATNIKKSSQKIIETIKDGGLVIINVNASWLNGGSGHYIVAKSLDSNNDLIIADPYADSLTSPVRNNVSASKIIEDYVDNNHGWYMFTSDKSSAIAKKYCKVPDEEKGYLGNPINPDDTTRDFLNVASAKCFPKYCSGGPHSGFDLNSSTGAPAGTPVYAMDSGIVTYAGTYARNCYGFCVNNNAPGLGVTINHGNGYETGYWHFSKRVVNKGEKVSKGQLIGYVGNTGNSTGPHLHITLKNIKLYSKYGWNGARGSDRKGFMNAAKYINKNKSYVGQSR